MKSKRKLGSLDERIEMHTAHLDIQYDHNDTPISKLKYRLSEVKEDVNILLNRNKHRGSMNNIPIGAISGQPEFAPIERKGRSSLIPFRFSMGSNLSHGGAASEKA